MKKFAVTALSIGLMTGLTTLSACTKKDAATKTTTASTVASTVVAAQPNQPSQPAASAVAPAIIASTVVVANNASAPAATVVTPDTAVAAGASQNTTTTTTTTTTTAPAQQAAGSQRTPLQADLITFLAAGQNLQQEAMTKQSSMEKDLKAKAEKAKTPEQQAAFQKELLTDVVAFKSKQKQTLSNVQLTEPRVKAVRDKMVAALDNDIKATQIVLKNPNPTPETKKSFDAEMKKMENANRSAAQQLKKLMDEAGMSQEPPAKSSKK